MTKTRIKGQNFQVAFSPMEKGLSYLLPWTKLPQGAIFHGEKGIKLLFP
jgi:hypothetical protein